MSQEALDTPSNHDDEKPNHMIIWLDSSIGNPNEYLHLKKAFASNTDPRHETWTMLTDKDYDNLLIATEAQEGHANWAVDYIGYIQMFDFDADLLERMTLDISKYFIERSKRLRQDNDLKGALQRLHWAKKLCHQHDKMAQKISTDNPRPVQESQTMKDINALINEIEQILPEESSLRNRSSSDNDDNEEDYVRSSEPSS
ncbi:unnamed protein product [Rotaria sordida]|uniref:Uncharacterized protein n=1 Tax=Rotaria sordida TaxID=392033 RepID=A0A814LM62_9BILA|nr:unnamed protein product [Rotaria sordida]CAF3912166.1 unnamed protein product [Rotaria sordida]